MFEKWKESGFVSDLKPSVDRTDSLKGYSFDNIELVTWSENKRRSYVDSKLGIGSNGECCKVVGKYDSSGKLIKEYISQQRAAIEAGLSQSTISRAILNNSLTWRRGIPAGISIQLDNSKKQR